MRDARLVVKVWLWTIASPLELPDPANDNDAFAIRLGVDELIFSYGGPSKVHATMLRGGKTAWRNTVHSRRELNDMLPVKRETPVRVIRATLERVWV